MSFRILRTKLAILAFLAVLPTISEAEPGCQSETIAFFLSPDDSLVALVSEETCSGDGPASVGATDIVHIVERGKTTTRSNAVFAKEAIGSSLNRPLIRWLTDRELQITVPNTSLIGLQKNEYAGVRISVKFEPDDPSARDRWLESRGLKMK